MVSAMGKGQKPEFGAGLDLESPWRGRIAAVLGVAAAYFVAGKLGLLLAIPPGYATAVWPASGIALAAALLYGGRAWAGVLLGSFLVNVGVSFDSSSTAAAARSVAIAASIGAGAALQAAISAGLIRRFVGYPTALESGREVALFVLLGAAAGCLVNASWSVSTLAIAGAISLDNVGFTWWTWWAGDAIGVLIFAPLILAWLGEPRDSWRHRRWTLTLALALTFAVAVGFFVRASDWEQARIRSGFARSVAAAGDDLQVHLDRYVDALNAVADYRAARGDFGRADFGAFVAGALRRIPGIQGISWNPRIRLAGRGGHEAALRGEAGEGTGIAERGHDGRLVPAAAREEYVYVRYIEPLATNRAALGFDVLSDAPRRDVLDRARDSGGAASLAPVALVQDARPVPGMLIFVPVYRDGLAPQHVAARRESLVGYVAGVFRIPDVVAEALRGVDPWQIRIRLRSRSGSGVEEPLYSNLPPGAAEARGPDAKSAGLTYVHAFDFAGSHWLLSGDPTPRYLEANRSWQAWGVLASALVFAGLLGAFLLVVTGRAGRVERLAAQLRRFRVALDNSPDIVLIIDRATMRHVDANETACKLLGYRREELLALGPEDILPMPRSELEQLYDRLIASPDQPSGMRSHYLCKDGSQLPFESTRRLLRHGERWLIVVVSRDIREKLDAERALLESEAGLRRAQAMAKLAHVVTDHDGAFESWSETLPSLAGVEPGAMPHSTRQWLALVHPEDRERFRACCIAAGRSGARAQVEYRLGREGEWRQVRQVMEPIEGDTDARGRSRWFNTMQDVTEERRGAEALAASESRHRAMFEQAAVGIVHSTLEGRLLHANDKFCELSGYARQEALGLTIRELTHPEDIGVSAGIRAKVLSGEVSSYLRELRLVRKDGSTLWAGVATSLVRDAQRAPAYFLSILQDISDRRRAEEEMRRFRAAIDASVDSIYITDVQAMRFVYVNDAACRRLGYARERLLAMGPQDVLKADVEALRREYEQVIAAGEAGVRTESRFVKSDGGEGWTEIHRRALHGAGGWLVVTIGRDVSERKQAEMELAESEARFRSLSQLSADWFWQTDAEHRFVDTPARVTQLTGMRANAYVGKRRWEVEGLVPVSGDWVEHWGVLERRESFRDFELVQNRADGSRVYLQVSGEPIYGAGGALAGYRGTARDITERMRAAERIRRLNRVYAVLSGINTAIVRIRDRDELYREACRVAHEVGGFPAVWIGLLERESKIMKPVAWIGGEDAERRLRDVRLSVAGEEQAERSLLGRMVKTARAAVSNDVPNDPDARYKEDLAALGIRSAAFLPLVVAGEVAGAMALYSSQAGFFDDQEIRLLSELAGDISFALEHLEKSERADFLAFYDELTGLANRRLLAERLGQAIHAAGHAQGKLALALLDLERMRTVNESLGRQAGDALLREVAARLARCAEPAELGRVSANHFAVLVQHVKGRSEIARRLDAVWRGCFGEPFRIENSELRAGARMGVAVYPADGSDAETLLGNAEAALRKAKRGGERRVFYESGLTERAGEELTLETKLRRALENDEFVLHYQPKVSLDNGAIEGIEALIRWQSPELGLVPPGKFIRLMEETGLILEVGAWALRRAAADHRALLQQQLRAPRVAVNVSAIQLRQRDFVRSVEQAIIEGVAPTGIDLEITESLVMEDVEENIRKLNEVRALGVQIAVDDFGTGYSSLGYLAKLPVQALKIDRSFIIAMLKDPAAMTLVQTIIALAHSLGLKVVAEGVDEDEQAKYLRLLRCDQMQGYLFSRPVPLEEVAQLLAARAAVTATPSAG